MQQFTESSDGAQAELKLDELFEILLAERPTAGYRWRALSGGEPVCRLVSSTFEPDMSRLGAAGLHRWRFVAAQPGSSALEFAYTRSWPSSGPAEKAFTLHLRVAE